MKKMNNKGFSLVELIIVMAIMAVLIGVMAPAYSKYVEQAKKSRDVSAIDSMMTAVESVLIDLDARKEGDLTTGEGADATKIHKVILTFKNDGSKIVFNEANTSCTDAITELELILGKEGTVMAGTWKVGDTVCTTGTLEATIKNGFVDFNLGAGDTNFFKAVAEYSDALKGRME